MGGNMTKIMLVEDDKSLREIYGVRLLAEGFEITSAGDGEEALAMAVKEHPDLIVSDVMMPKISGFDMLDILRATPETKDIKIIMMTALSSEDQRARGESLGANRYLVKSQVGIEDVVKAVHEVLDSTTATATPANQTPGAPTPSATIPQPSGPPTQPSQSAPEPEVTTTPELAPESIPIPEPKFVIMPEPEPILKPEPTSPMPDQNPAMPSPDITTPSVPVQIPVQMAPSVPIEAPILVTPPTPEPVEQVQLPQPTAPFSTAAPASLGDRTINPIQQPTTPTPDIATLMSQELNDTSPAPQNFGQ